jgi:hypothetical protein
VEQDEDDDDDADADEVDAGDGKGPDSDIVASRSADPSTLEDVDPDNMDGPKRKSKAAASVGASAATG